MNLYFQQTTIGKIGIAEESNSITNLFFETDIFPQDFEISETPIIREAFRQLEAWLSGNLQKFALPLAPHGTDFMRNIWKLLCEVSYGTTASYKELAVAAGNPKAVRAVGLACNRNPIPLFIPCHRIIGSNGKLTGYRGGLELKKRLLKMERAAGSSL